jgi:hypothetical protein
MKKRGRRGFDEQFRREAVHLANSGRMPLAQVARLGFTSRRSAVGAGKHGPRKRLWARGPKRWSRKTDGSAGRMRGCVRSARS